MEFKVIVTEKPEDSNIIIGQAHFIKTVEDLYEAVVNAVPCAKFGIAFCEASQKCLVRTEGNDEELRRLAAQNAFAIGTGHLFLILLKDAYPINILQTLKMVPEVCHIYCATANPLAVIVGEAETGRSFVGVIDGERLKGIEGEEERRERKEFLRKIGYKLE